MIRLGSLPILIGLSFVPSFASAQGGVDLTVTQVSSTSGAVPYYDPVAVDFIVDAGGFTGNVAYDVAIVFAGGNPLPVASGLAFVTGSATTVTTTFVVPTHAAVGIQQRVVVTIDPSNVVVESNETNNTTNASNTFEILGAELRAVSVVGPGLASRGSTINVTATFANDVATEARDFTYTIRLLSSNPGSVQLVAVPNVTLAGNTSTTVSHDVVIPVGTPLGQATLRIQLDTTQRVPESTNVNNTGATFLQIVDPAPDFTIQVADVPAMVEMGQRLDVQRIVGNDGDLAGLADWAFYLSTDRTITTMDSPMGGAGTVTLDVGQANVGRSTLTVPSGIMAGVYFVGAIVDPNMNVPELNESNNTGVFGPINVFEADLSITTASLRPATVAEPYVQPLVAQGGNGMNMWSSVGPFPPGLQVDPGGSIIGTPTMAGVFAVTIDVTDGQRSASRMLSLRVFPEDAPLEIITPQLPTAVLGQPYRFDVNAAGGTPPYRWLATDGLPGGLTFDTAGRFAGTPAVVGQFTVAIRVTDADNDRVDATFDLAIVDLSNDVQLVQTQLRPGMVGVPYCDRGDVSIEALGGVTPYAFQLLEGTAPGMTLETSGRFCGTPTMVGMYSFTVEVRDATGRVDVDRYSFEVSSGGLRITTETLPDALIGKPYEAALAVEGGVEPFSWTLTQGVPPPGISLDGDGVFRGAPTELGTFTLAVMVRDAVGDEHTAPLAIRVVTSSGGLSEGGEVGCGCHTAPRGGSAWALLIVLLMLMLRAGLRCGGAPPAEECSRAGTR